MSDDPTDRILSAIRDLGAAMGVLGNRMDDLVVRVDRIEAGQEGLRGDLLKARTDVMDRMDRLQDAIGTLRDDVAVNFGATDTVRRSHDTTREELRSLNDAVSTLVRQYRSLNGRVEDIERRR